MTSPSIRIRGGRATVAAATAAMALSLGLPALAGSADAAGAGEAGAPRPVAGSARPAPTVAEARAALARAERLVRPVSARAAAAALARGGRNATMVLRQVAATRSALEGEERERADALLRRPTSANGDGFLTYTTAEATPVCSDVVCIHYVTSTEDAVDPTDTDNNEVPDYVDSALSTFSDVHRTYTDAGYRPSLPDDGLGGSDLIDVYLGNTGSGGVYGYCTTDEPDRSGFDRWAYCAVDNDFSSDEFPSNTPLGNLQVTAAHEYFHAVQYAYDVAEDSWLLEATAAWVEDEVYDDVNDNRQYLENSILAKPELQLDRFGEPGVFHYGQWIFFRYLTEKYTARTGTLPDLVRRIFEEGSGRVGESNACSLPAIQTALGEVGTDLPTQFALFSAAARRPTATFAEGAALSYPAAPLAGNAILSARTPKRVVPTRRMNHLTSATYRITPQGFTNAKDRVRLTINMQPTARGSRAVLTTYPKVGTPTVRALSLNAAGDASPNFPFSLKSVRYYEVTLVNASTRLGSSSGDFSCGRTMADDGLSAALTVQAYRAR
ncbi:MXAN_6640 family putative metalloprotease [Nocardioides sp.]|uniref:MXAN_6640 family putative metalloprotease n=1 Tax=Nocardioides sp. TaxID=35761 RepID=UPI00351281AC